MGSFDILNQHTIPTFKGLIDELHGFWETFADEIGLAMRPMEFEIVHSGPTALYMRGIVSRLRCGVGDAEIWRRHEGTQWLSGAVIKDSSNLLGHI